MYRSGSTSSFEVGRRNPGVVANPSQIVILWTSIFAKSQELQDVVAEWVNVTAAWA
jgi:hypothetical protein